MPEGISPFSQIADGLKGRTCKHSAECESRRSGIGGSGYCELLTEVAAIRAAAMLSGHPDFDDQVLGEAEIDLLMISTQADSHRCAQPRQVLHEIGIVERALGITD